MYMAAFLAELDAKSGQTEDGLAVIAEAQILADENKDECYYIAEMLRLKGQLLMQGAKHKLRETARYDEVETCFLRAIKIAQQQGAKSLELRAAVSLCRLWQRQGKRRQRPWGF
jgi:ATP/maltotriose-dependent transcriptional regulator MalT